MRGAAGPDLRPAMRGLLGSAQLVRTRRSSPRTRGPALLTIAGRARAPVAAAASPAGLPARPAPSSPPPASRSACSRACATCCPAATSSGSPAAAPRGAVLHPGTLPDQGLARRRRTGGPPSVARVAFRDPIAAYTRPRFPAFSSDEGVHVTTLEAPETHLRENPFEIARSSCAASADDFGIDDNLVSVLAQCKKAVEVSIPVTMDDGSIEVFTGLPRHAQRRARAVEGRDPLPPGRHARRGQGARDVDDVEVRADGHPVRRREGRRRSATRRRCPRASSSA